MLNGTVLYCSTLHYRVAYKLWLFIFKRLILL